MRVNEGIEVRFKVGKSLRVITHRDPAKTLQSAIKMVSPITVLPELMDPPYKRYLYLPEKTASAYLSWSSKVLMRTSWLSEFNLFTAYDYFLGVSQIT